MSTDIKPSKTHISNIIQSGRSFGSWLANLIKKALKIVAIYLARDNLPGLVSNLVSNAINKFERKISGKGAFRARKGITLFILNEDVNGIIKIMKLLEDSEALIDRVTETLKHEMKKQKGEFHRALLAPLFALLAQLVISSVIKGINGRGFRRSERGYTDKIF